MQIFFTCYNVYDSVFSPQFESGWIQLKESALPQVSPSYQPSSFPTFPIKEYASIDMALPFVWSPYNCLVTFTPNNL